MEIAVSTDAPIEVRDVTDRVAAALVDGPRSGPLTVFVPHTTAGVVVNEPESGLLADLEAVLADVVPADVDYAHDRIDDNAAAHLRAAILGESVTVPIEDGELALGTWQAILFVELDGPRERRLRLVPNAG